MTDLERSDEILIFFSLIKALNEQSTYFINDKLGDKVFSKKLKTLINSSEHVLRNVERKLNASDKQFLENVVDVYHNINLEIKKELKQKRDAAA